MSAPVLAVNGNINFGCVRSRHTCQHLTESIDMFDAKFDDEFDSATIASDRQRALIQVKIVTAS